MSDVGEVIAGLTNISGPDGLGLETDNGVVEVVLAVGAAVALAIFAWRRGGRGKGDAVGKR